MSDAPPRRRRRRNVGGARQLASGRVQVRVRGVTPDGARFELARVCDPDQVEEVRAELMREKRDVAAGLRPLLEHLTLREWCERFKKKHPWTKERVATWRLLRPLHGIELRALSSADVTAWARRATYKGPGRAPARSGKGSPAYVRHAFELLTVMLRAAIDSKPPALDRMPWASRPPGVPSSSGASKKRRPLTETEVRALLEAARRRDTSPDLWLRLALQLQTGVRPHELCRLRAEWMLTHADLLSLMPSAPDGCGAIAFPAAKGGEPHICPLPAELVAALSHHMAALPPAARATGLVFPIKWRRRWRQRDTWVTHTTWRELREDAGLPADVVLYQLRHTRLSEVANDPAGGTRAAAALAGHKDDRTTQTYLGAAATLSPALFQPSRALRPDDEPEPDGSGGGKVVRGRFTRSQKRGGTRRAAERRAPPPDSPKARRSGHAPEVISAPAPTVPPEDGDAPRLRALAERVLADGAPALAAELTRALPPAEAAAFAGELDAAAGAEPALRRGERAALERLSAAVRGTLGANLARALESEAISDSAVAVELRFTRSEGNGNGGA